MKGRLRTAGVVALATLAAGSADAAAQRSGALGVSLGLAPGLGTTSREIQPGVVVMAMTETTPGNGWWAGITVGFGFWRGAPYVPSPPDVRMLSVDLTVRRTLGGEATSHPYLLVAAGLDRIWQDQEFRPSGNSPGLALGGGWEFRLARVRPFIEARWRVLLTDRLAEEFHPSTMAQLLAGLRVPLGGA